MPYFHSENRSIPIPKGFTSWEEVMVLRMKERLAHQPLTSTELAKMLQRPVSQVRDILARHFTLKDGKWELKA
jgi:hypothetical protein